MTADHPVTRSADLRIGRLVAWTAGITTLLGMIALLLVPPVAGLIAQITWTDDAKEACEASAEPCTPSLIPGYALPVWVGWAWVAILLLCLLVSWSPRRWWTPQDRTGAPKQPGLYSTPEWLRGLALVAAITTLAMTWGVGRGSLPAPEFLWPALFGVFVAVAASVCIYSTAGDIAPATSRGLATGYTLWLLPPERRRRMRLARQAEAAPSSPGEGTRRERRRG